MRRLHVLVIQLWGNGSKKPQYSWVVTQQAASDNCARGICRTSTPYSKKGASCQLRQRHAFLYPILIAIQVISYYQESLLPGFPTDNTPWRLPNTLGYLTTGFFNEPDRVAESDT
jgi:hypothetical protein